MKSKIFKKAIAGISAIAMVAQFGIVLPASAEGLPDATYVDGKLTLPTAATEGTAAIVATYDSNGCLKKVKCTSIEAGKTEASLNAAIGDKIMVWNGFDNITPLTNAVNVTPTVDPKVVLLDEKFTSDSVTNPADGSYTWGDITSMLANKKGLLLTNANSASNNYENKDIVTFKESVGGTGNKISIGYNVAYQEKSKGQSYSDYKVSYFNENDKFMFSITESIGNWADKAYIEYADSETTTAKEEVSTHIGKAVSADVQFGTNCGYLTVDGTMYRFVTDSALKSVKATVSGGQDYNRGIYITNYKMTTEPCVLEEYCLVSYDVEGTISTDSVVSGNSVAADKIPSTDKKGYVFDGWQMNDDADKLYSTDEVKAMEITADVKFTAKYHMDAEYVQSIASIEFTKAESAVIKYGAESGQIDNYEYTVKVTSDIGNDITDDCTFEWTIAGQSDDGYVDLNTDDENKTGKTRQLRVRQGGEGCYGYIKATATYTKNAEGEKMSAQVPYAVITESAVSGQILPKAGYPISMDDYKDNLVGYKATADGTDVNKGDLVLDNWVIVGSNGTRDLLLDKDESGKKSIKITNVGGDRGPAGSSCVGAMAFPTQTSQYIFETIVKFEGNGRIGVWDKTPNNQNPTDEWSISYDDTGIKAGDQTIAGVKKSTWYKVVVTSDPANKLFSVYVYDMAGEEVGKALDNTGKAAGKILCVDAGFPVYINSLRAYEPTTDSVSISSDVDVIQVPENETDPANEVNLTALCSTADGIKLTGAVTWSLEGEPQGVELVPSTTNVQQATLKISNGAAGTVKVNATKDGKTASKEITLTTSKNVVTFKQSKSSITIPFEGEDATTAVYEASTVGKDEELPADKTITYSFLDKTGAAELTTLPNGITSSVENNVLTISVASDATPINFYVKATDADGLSTKILVNVHGLTYTFGNTEAEGTTQVSAATLYTDTLGYGFEDTTKVEDETNNVKGSSDYKFKVKIPNGNYRVDVVTTSESMQSEIVDEAVAKGANVTGIFKSGATFNVAVCDEVLDLTFKADSTLSLLSISQIAAKEKREKPAIFAIGDSTTKNADNGGLSWGNCAEAGKAALPDKFSSFANHGQAGRDSVNYYNQGRIEAVLMNICPGDYVTINMGINARPESGNEKAAFPLLVEKYYAQAVAERGGIPVIVTATPDGATWNNDRTTYNWGSNYANGKFNNNRGDGAGNNLLRAIAKDNGYNLIELGQAGQDWMNTLTDDDVTAYNTANGTAYTSVPEMVANWYVDHNHYKEPIGTWIAGYLFSELEKMVDDPDYLKATND